jgi:ABC-type multidrug transport system ATPase subunit
MVRTFCAFLSDPARPVAAFMIDVDQLTKDFVSGGRSCRAVDAVSFQVRPGEVYGLLGPNGAGKTTTLRMILGLLSPTRGEATVVGKLV